MPETNGFDNSAMLPVGTLLQDGKYRIERYLSSGGFGNTYVATNTEFEEQVAIKEFFMRGISDRNGDSVSVSVSNKTNVEQFTSQKEKFRKEARRLRKLRNRSSWPYTTCLRRTARPITRWTSSRVSHSANA